MKPEHLSFGGGASGTILHPLAAVAMLLAVLLILALPRRQAIVPFLLVTFLLPMSQEIDIGGMHWVVLRIVVLFGCSRLLWEKLSANEKLFPGGLNTIDKVFLVWAISRGVAPILLFHTGAAVPLQIAVWLQEIGGYFLLRHLIQDVEDIGRVAKTLALVVLIMGLCMANERVHGINIFGYLGGMSIAPEVRDGVIRANAAFAHPLLAGCFGATLLPLMCWLFKSGKGRWLAVLAAAAALAMVVFAASSTSYLACVGGIGALFLWPMRGSMRLVRWGIVLTLVGLQLVMKAPVWFVISHIDLTGASSGYHRAMLIDTFLRHFKDWWLIGTNQTGGWGWDMWDLSNTFVDQGEIGGLVAFVCFIAIISKSFGRLGKMRKQVEGDQTLEWLCWSLCAVMFAHITSYFGVSYFDQTEMWWLAFLAMVSAATAALVKRPAAAAEESEPPLAEVTVGSPDLPEWENFAGGLSGV